MKTPLTPAAVVIPAVVLGVAGDLLFRNSELDGLNLPLWIGGVTIGWLWLRFRAGETVTRDERLLLGAIGAIAIALLWRDNALLRLLNIGALAVCAVLLPVAAAGGRGAILSRLRLIDAWQALLRFASRILSGLLPGLVDSARGRSEATSRVPVAAVLRGTLFAVPLLGIFGGLLSGADQNFAEFLNGMVQFDGLRVVDHTLIVLVCSWLAAALVGGAILLPRSASADGPACLPPAGLGTIEVGIMLGSMNLLFAGFIGFQLPHFFGGMHHVSTQSGVTLSMYARTGFFELVVVAALVLPVLLLIEYRSRDVTGHAPSLYRALALVQVLLVCAIMVSAIHRMSLYQREFGLTEDRFFASAAIAGLAVTCGWFVMTVLRGAGHRFAGGTLVAWAAWLALLNLVNPERIIVETNLARQQHGQTVDIAYLAGLSADAVPAIFAEPALSSSYLVDHFRHRTDLYPLDSDWRRWHAGRARARTLLETHGLRS